VLFAYWIHETTLEVAAYAEYGHEATRRFNSTSAVLLMFIFGGDALNAVQAFARATHYRSNARNLAVMIALLLCMFVVAVLRFFYDEEGELFIEGLLSANIILFAFSASFLHFLQLKPCAKCAVATWNLILFSAAVAVIILSQQNNGNALFYGHILSNILSALMLFSSQIEFWISLRQEFKFVAKQTKDKRKLNV